MSFNIAILGGGPGGYVAAIRAAQMGAKVCVVEKDYLGGTCLNRGCIPTKALVAGAERLALLRHASEFGINTGEVTINLEVLMDRKNKVVERLVNGIQYLFKKNKITLVQGEGKLVSPNKISVSLTDGSTKEITAEKIIVATGSEPALIQALGYDGERVITSNEALNLSEIPKSLLIIGGGVIGCEFASIFGEMGTQITIVDVMPTILPMVDKDVSRTMQTAFKKRGITIKTKVKITEVKKSGTGVTAVLESGEEITAEKVLISIGRTFNTKDIGLEDIGVALGNRGEVLVNDKMETNIAGVYAIGDITNKIQLAHVASAQGIVAVENIMGRDTVMDYSVVPSCIFTIPEVAVVGMSGQEAEEKGLAFKTGKFPFMASGKAQAMGETEGFVKIIAEAETDKVLGVHIVGPHATDLIAEAALAMKTGATVEDIANTIHAHPTLAEAMLEAAEAVHGKAIHV